MLAVRAFLALVASDRATDRTGGIRIYSRSLTFTAYWMFDRLNLRRVLRHSSIQYRRNDTQAVDDRDTALVRLFATEKVSKLIRNSYR